MTQGHVSEGQVTTEGVSWSQRPQQKDTDVHCVLSCCEEIEKKRHAHSFSPRYRDSLGFPGQKKEACGSLGKYQSPQIKRYRHWLWSPRSCPLWAWNLRTPKTERKPRIFQREPKLAAKGRKLKKKTLNTHQASNQRPRMPEKTVDFEGRGNFSARQNPVGLPCWAGNFLGNIFLHTWIWHTHGCFLKPCLCEWKTRIWISMDGEGSTNFAKFTWWMTVKPFKRMKYSCV
jgi:hypothetical protein